MPPSREAIHRGLADRVVTGARSGTTRGMFPSLLQEIGPTEPWVGVLVPNLGARVGIKEAAK